MRILLVQPEYLTRGIGFRLVALPEPLHLEMVAALVPDHEVRILDMRLDEDLPGALESFAPDLVAVTALTTEVYAARDAVRDVKAFSAEIFTVVGGHHASLLPEDLFIPEVDAVAVGEAELVFGPLVQALADRQGLEDVPNLIWQDRDGHFVRNRPAQIRFDLNTLAIPRRDLTAAYRDKYFFLFDKPDTSVATSRGCPFRCNFCSVWAFYGGRTAQMSAQRVVQELHTVQTAHVTFVDDNFCMNYQREDAIADMVRAEGIQLRFSMEARTDSIAKHPELIEKWRDVGLYAALVGLEGADDQALRNVNKSNTAAANDRALEILRDNGIIIWGAFIVDPDWTEDDFKRLRDYVNRNEVTHTQFTVLTPLPGTKLYRDWFDKLLTYDYSCFDTLHAVVPTRLPREVFYQNYANLYRQTDLGPYLDLVRDGKLTIEDCRRGKAMLDAMTRWERLIEMDPVLGKCRDKSEALPGAILAGAPLNVAK